MSSNAKQDAAAGRGERIAKVLARAGICSRRDAEKLIEAGRVAVDGKVLSSPAFNVQPGQRIAVDGKPVAEPERTRLWLYHKPRGLLTSHRDPGGRPTVFAALPRDLPRVVSVGRLDFNSEGLLLLTNDGGLARRLELPSSGWLRRYRVRVFGQPAPETIASLARGITIDRVAYGPVKVALDSTKGGNSWLTMSLREGKNREVRRLLEHFGHQVSRLIRTAYGPFQLGTLKPGEVREVSGKILREQLGEGAPQPAKRRGQEGK